MTELERKEGAWLTGKTEGTHKGRPYTNNPHNPTTVLIREVPTRTRPTCKSAFC